MKCQKLVCVLEYKHLYQINDISTSILDCIHFGQLKIHIELWCGKWKSRRNHVILRRSIMEILISCTEDFGFHSRVKIYNQ